MKLVPQVYLKYIEDVERFPSFVDWLHRNMKGWNPTSTKPDCFACARCHKDLPFEDGGIAISFKVDNNGWHLYISPLTKKYEFAMCKHCFGEVLCAFGMDGKNIDSLMQAYKPTNHKESRIL